jgi:hypothetical protein
VTDGYVQPTGRGETKTLESALPVVQGPSVKGTRPQRSAANAGNAPGIGTSDTGDNVGTVDRECEPYGAFESRTGSA